MAFNGTKSYPKNDLIKYFQSIGLSFGGDLNAHTGFNETVYKLKVPVNKNLDNLLNISPLESGFKILREWSDSITLDENEVLNEKNIILEEWRLTQGLSQRVSEAKRKNIFGDSLYSKRLPIGTMETIETMSKDQLKYFYETWYLPKNSAVIAVGDFEEKEIEEYITSYFSDLNIRGDNSSKKTEASIIGETKDSYTIFKDPEIVSSTFEISFLKKIETINTTLTLKDEIIDLLWENILNSRIDIIKKQKDSSIFSGIAYSYRITPKEKITTFSARLDENKILEGINLVYENLKLLSTYGPSEFELNNEKNELLSSIKLSATNSNSMENEEYMSEIKNLFLYGDTFLNPEDNFKNLEKILPSITVSDIKNRANDFFYKNSSKFLSLPQKDNLNLITKEKIKEIYMSTMNNKIQNRNFSEEFNLKISQKKPGTIVSKIENSEYSSYLLSNGLKVKYKNTNLDKDKIYLKLFKMEGSSSEDENFYFNSLITPFMMNSSGIGNLTVEETLTFMKGKSFELSPYLRDYEQGIEIISNEENLDIAIDSGILVLTEPNFDSRVFDNLKLNLLQQIKNQNNSPKSFYKNEILKTLNDNNIRRISITEDNLKLITEDSVKSIYEKNFSSYDNYNLVVVGSISPENFEKLLINKFSSLPIKNNNISFKKLNIEYPKEIISKKIVKGTDKKASVTIIYPFHLPYTFENKNFGEASSEILNTILLEKIREELGAVYSISSRSNISYNNYGENYLSITFLTDWKNSDEVSKAVKNVVKEVLDGKYPEKKIINLWKSYELNYETSRNKNIFWFNFLYASFFSIENFKNLKPEEYKNIIVQKKLNDFLKKAFKFDNYIEITLLPETN